MQSWFSRLRQPVEREGNEHYLRLMLLSFAASVSLTRLFLQLTGYPQLGSKTLHIAHLLWGGLLLFAAAFLMLTLANRWTYTVAALMTGAGIGLFIDEVGKFITQDNNYFYPPAAPIIYAFFLVVVLLYLEVRRRPNQDARAELYRAFDAFQEVLDRDLDEPERAALETRLRHVSATADHPELKHLAETLLDFLNSDAPLVPHTPSLGERFSAWLRKMEAGWVTRRRLKGALVLGLVLLGGEALLALLVYIVLNPNPAAGDPLTWWFVARPAAELAEAGHLAGPDGMRWFAAQLALNAAVGLLLLIAASLLALRREARGLRLGYLGLLISLTVVDLMVFYLNQFSALWPTLFHFGVLLILLRYRWRYHSRPAPS